MDKMISIIIPVYNAEEYLSECIESVLGQTYKNIELLLINDGSTDKSGEICDEYAQRDPRIQVIHKPNGGVSSARNMGLCHFKGEYVTFVDADDLIDRDFAKKMYENANQNDSNLVFCRFARYVEGNVYLFKEDLPLALQLDRDNKEKIDFLSRFFNSKKYIPSSACRILYERKIVTGVFFHKDIRIGEDWMFLLHSILRADRVSSVNEVLYFYRANSNSATHSFYKDYLNNQLNILYELDSLFGDMKEAKNMLLGYSALLCYQAVVNEIKNPSGICRKNIKEIRKSKLYHYFKIKNLFKVNNIKKRVKYFIAWFLVKTRLI